MVLEACWQSVAEQLKRSIYPQQALTKAHSPEFTTGPTLPHNATRPALAQRRPLPQRHLPSRRLILPLQYNVHTRYCAGPRTTQPHQSYPVSSLCCCACPPSQRARLAKSTPRERHCVKNLPISSPVRTGNLLAPLATLAVSGPSRAILSGTSPLALRPSNTGTSRHRQGGYIDEKRKTHQGVFDNVPRT